MLFSPLLWAYYYISSLIYGVPSPHRQDAGMASYLNHTDMSNMTLYEPLYPFKIYGFMTTEKNELRIASSAPLDAGVEDDTIFSFFVKMDESALHSHVRIPAIDDKETIKSLIKMASNSFYVHGNDTSFLDFRGHSDEHWDEKAIRGYVYTNPSKNLVILSISGNVPHDTVSKGAIEMDKFNSNNMFSCCCAQVDFTWNPICPCFISGSSCSKSCLVDYARGRMVGFFSPKAAGTRRCFKSRLTHLLLPGSQDV